MKHLSKIIVRTTKSCEKIGAELPYNDSAQTIMNDEHFVEYVKANGYHFTDALAQEASSMMTNTNGTEHSWTTKQVEAVVGNYGGKDVYNKCTLGDLTYLANMAYADFYPEVIKDESSCIKYALAVASDPDGYDGIAFMRWLSDIIGKGITDINWK